MRMAEGTSLKPKTVFRWFIRKGCPFIKDNHVQLLEKSFGHFPFLTKPTLIQLSKETSLTPKTICEWFMEEYKIFDKELGFLIKLNKQSRVTAQKRISEASGKNGQKSATNRPQWHPEHRVINREGTRQTRSTRHNSFKLQKLQNLQNLLVKNGSFTRLGK